MDSLTPQIIQDSLIQVLGTIVVVVAFVVVLELFLYYVLKKKLQWKFSLPIMLVTPAAIGLAMLVLYPIAYNIVLACSNMSLRRFTVERGLTYGFAEAWNNLKIVFTEPVLKQQKILPVLLRTFLWTFIQIFFHVTLGMMIAILLNRPMKLRGFYRTLLLFPWAIPQIIAVLAWRGEFNYEYGLFNLLIKRFGGQPINWMSNPLWNFVAKNLTNIWLGVPFMTVILLGGLQSIDPSYYEAAEMDGAGRISSFRRITLPLMKPITTPAIILGVIWTFNQFNVPYFINQFELETSDILVTALFRAAFEYNRYGFASMFALIIFIILLGFTLIYIRITKFTLGFEVSGNKTPLQAVGE
ncbi:MAG: sugar ABC transporter permease [Bacteroidetes bacterium]|nr:sugar ABC transporter permease [Bacteroidota bacterium]